MKNEKLKINGISILILLGLFAYSAGILANPGIIVVSTNSEKQIAEKPGLFKNLTGKVGNILLNHSLQVVDEKAFIDRENHYHQNIGRSMNSSLLSSEDIAVRYAVDHVLSYQLLMEREDSFFLCKKRGELHIKIYNAQGKFLFSEEPTAFGMNLRCADADRALINNLVVQLAKLLNVKIDTTPDLFKLSPDNIIRLYGFDKNEVKEGFEQILNGFTGIDSIQNYQYRHNPQDIAKNESLWKIRLKEGKTQLQLQQWMSQQLPCYSGSNESINRAIQAIRPLDSISPKELAWQYDQNKKSRQQLRGENLCFNN